MADERTRRLVQASTDVILSQHIEPTEDIRNERAKVSIDVKGLARYLNGGKDALEKREQLVKLLEAQPWADKSRIHYYSRSEEYVRALEASIGLWALVKENKISVEEEIEARKLMNMPGGLELHLGMFIPSLLSQATAEQQSKWLPKAMGLELVGTYAQTELGHGTFLRGLQTTATYDCETEEFIAHSPTLSSTKWWPGGLGKTATHVLLVARLFIKGKEYGPHAFIVQIRDLETHLPLPGVTVGDIGPKLGHNAVDNGFLQFDHYRFSRDNMLMRYAKVAADGRYTPPPPENAKASYSTMMHVRSTIVEDAGWHLAKAVTIAVRYTAVRRQTAPTPGEPELQVLNYQNVANDLLPLVAAAYALIFMGKASGKMYRAFGADRDRGDFSVLPELHSILSGMKALSTWIASSGSETCRRACGGHGFSMLSGLPSLFASYVQNVTLEGDNSVLCLQTARYLLKQLLSAQQGQSIAGTTAYLAHTEAAKSPVISVTDWFQSDLQEEAFRQRASSLVLEAAETLQRAGNGHVQFQGAAWNGNTVALIRAARSHLQLVLFQMFARSMEEMAKEAAVPARTVAVLRQLTALFGLSQILEDAGDFLEIGHLSRRQVGLARAAHCRLLKQLRPEAVGLVDVFAISDYVLDSPLGRYDGDAYRDLLARAQLSPLNDTQEGPAWPVLKEVLSQGVVRAKL